MVAQLPSGNKPRCHNSRLSAKKQGQRFPEFCLGGGQGESVPVFVCYSIYRYRLIAPACSNSRTSVSSSMGRAWER